MDLVQRKLLKSEWNNIEIPVADKELKIIDLIKAGYPDVNIRKNDTQTLIKYMKVKSSTAIDEYIYTQYIQPLLLSLAKKHQLQIDVVDGTNKLMKKADIIRFQNTDKQLNEHKQTIFEFIVLELLNKLYQSKNQNQSSKNQQPKNEKWVFYYYTLKTLFSYTIESCNELFKTRVIKLLNEIDNEVTPKMLVESGHELIELNENILKYSDETLYDHQKKLFTLCKNPSPKLILYIAPTGTGKTLSPIGLSESHRVIFVCAARHVGLALAKFAVSSNKRIAFAFGCSDTDDIRLHYSAAKEYTRNKKTGGISKVDNSVGDNVEIMICDIKSYLPAMYYMLAFNAKENIIMFWDEPTITMDYDTHEFHDIIKKNWSNNLIPNVVLSSATLPHKEELQDVIIDFKTNFQDSECYEIISHDSKKTIPIINKNGYVEMPHYLYNETQYDNVLNVVAHCKKNKTLLRYIDLAEAIKFIMCANKPVNNSEDKNDNVYFKSNRYKLENNFSTFSSVNMSSIKEYYLDLLGNIKKEAWPTLYKELVKMRTKKMDSNINIVTTDAYTLTDGPTIFLANNIEKVARFYIQSANISDSVLKEIMTQIDANTKLNNKIMVMEKDLEDGTKKDENKEKKMTEGRVDPEMKKLMLKIDQTRLGVKSVFLNPKYIPNTKEHIKKYMKLDNENDETYMNNNNNVKRQFSCDISEHMVEQIMLVDDIIDMWKLLLLMGIGVFATHKSDRYTELMKTLAQEQKLYMIIASTDYIYGTNYQFCHGYISKDLETMSQEKCIQAMGRVGRNKIQQDYSIRFRDDDLILKLFNHEKDKPEIKNMNLLFVKE